MSDATNGKEQELPDRRKAAVAAGLEQYNHIADERDRFEAEARDLRTQIAGYKVALEANASHIAELESRVQSAVLERDKAVRERGDLLGLFKTIKATLYAFDVPFPDKIDEAERAMELFTPEQQLAQQALLQPRRYSPADLMVADNPRRTVFKPEGSS